jgi:hypothetical protein
MDNIYSNLVKLAAAKGLKGRKNQPNLQGLGKSFKDFVTHPSISKLGLHPGLFIGGLSGLFGQ